MNIFFKKISDYYSLFIQDILALKKQTSATISYLSEFKETSFNLSISVSCFILAILFANGDFLSSIPPHIIITSVFLFACVHLSVHFWTKSFHAKYQNDFLLTNMFLIIYSCFLETLFFIPLAYSIKTFFFISKSVPLLHFFLCMIIKLTILWANKIHRELTQFHTQKILKNKAIPIIVVGNQETVEQFIQEIIYSPAFSYDPQCILATENPEQYNISSSWSIPVLSIFNQNEIHKIIRTLPKKPHYIINTTSIQRSEISSQIQSISQKYSLPITQIILNFSNEHFHTSLVA